MFNTLLNDNVLRNIRIKCVIRIIRNTCIKQLSKYLSVYTLQVVRMGQSKEKKYLSCNKILILLEY